jgi:hypothetical protein
VRVIRLNIGLRIAEKWAGVNTAPGDRRRYEIGKLVGWVERSATQQSSFGREAGWALPTISIEPFVRLRTDLFFGGQCPPYKTVSYLPGLYNVKEEGAKTKQTGVMDTARRMGGAKRNPSNMF